MDTVATAVTCHEACLKYAMFFYSMCPIICSLWRSYNYLHCYSFPLEHRRRALVYLPVNCVVFAAVSFLAADLDSQCPLCECIPLENISFNKKLIAVRMSGRAGCRGLAVCDSAHEIHGAHGQPF